MQRTGAALGLLTVASLAGTAHAATTDYTVTGELKGIDNTCVAAILALFNGDDCSYNDKLDGTDGLEWIGPLYGSGLYVTGTEPDPFSTGGPAERPRDRTPPEGEPNLNPAITGTVTIDDNGTPGDGSDDTFTVVLQIAGATHHFNAGPAGWGNETWSSWDLTFSGTADTATANGSGGFDYVLGSLGPVPLITGTDSDIFPSLTGSTSTANPDPDYWNAPSPIAFSTLDGDTPTDFSQGSTDGASVFNGYSCDDATAGDCTSAAAYGVGLTSLDNIVLELSTTGGGGISSAQMLIDADVDTFGGADDDSWFALTGTFTAPEQNAVPVAEDDTASTDSGVLVNIDVLSNDTLGDDPNTVTVEAGDEPANGTAVVQGNNTIDYTPNGGFSGQDTFTYTLTDTDGDADTALVTVTVVDTNLLPTAADDTVEYLSTAASTNVDVLANDDEGDAPASITNVQNPSTLGRTVTTDGSTVTYAQGGSVITPVTGTDTFTYTITDSNGDTSQATVTMTDEGTPVAADDSAAVDVGGNVNINVLANDVGISDTPLTVTTTQPGSGSAAVQGDNSITFTAGNAGVQTFTYTVTDADGDNDTATVTVDVNDLPAAVDDNVQTAAQTLISIDVLANDSGLSDTPVTVAITAQPSNGTAVVNGNNIDYTPDAGATSDVLTYSVTDADGDSDTANVNITVANVPVANDDTATTAVNTPVDINVLANDTATDTPVTVTVTGAPSNGTTSVAANNVVTYTPNNNFSGNDVFTYTVTDNSGDTDTATVTVTVEAADVIVAVADSASVSAGGSVTVDVLANDQNKTDTPLTVQITGDPDNGTAVVNNDLTITYTNNGTSGNDTVTYTVFDNSGDESEAILTITVASANLPGGKSAIGGLGLALLLVVPWLRRRVS